MTYSLDPGSERLIEKHLKSGNYRSPGEVIGAALRLLDRREERTRNKLEALRHEIQVGIDEIERGEVIPGEQAFAEIREAVRKRTGR
ncbi:MAG TPA: type II toxin-antitoxin system ParD family antitoxin [Longimicrobiaceae bacterium]|nr:type II toxin-antitoxin system ParD family antitoxin [Longimicrobiaceae bacterium]